MMNSRVSFAVAVAVVGCLGFAAPRALGQAADACAQAPTVGPGTYAFDTTAATPTPNLTVSCGGTTESNADVWLRFVPTDTGIVFIRTCGLTALDSVLTVFDACGGAEVACNDDACDLESQVAVSVTQNQAVLIRISGYNQLRGSGQVEITAPPPGGWFEGAQDAGDLPASAQAPQGTGPLPVIIGNIHADGDADMYRISICNRTAFRATTVDGTAVDTMLALFTLDGRGVAFSDDDPGVALASTLTNQFVTSDGEYFLAITSYNFRPLGASGDLWLEDPFTVERQPDGPGAAEPVSLWQGETFEAGDYAITLTGVCYPGGGTSCPADVDDGTRTGTSDGAVTIDDLIYFLIAFEDGNLDADLDNGTRTGTQDGAVTIDDLVYFLIHFEEGC